VIFMIHKHNMISHIECQHFFNVTEPVRPDKLEFISNLKKISPDFSLNFF
jgi:hypothetical protein